MGTKVWFMAFDGPVSPSGVALVGRLSVNNG